MIVVGGGECVLGVGGLDDGGFFVVMGLEEQEVSFLFLFFVNF